jgi:hypothetical protein
MSLTKVKKKTQINPGESHKPGLIFQIHNPLNLRLGINQET